jgi:Holliday junction resolvase YEN1
LSAHDLLCSIYKEIGPGERISLCKLAVDHLEQTKRRLRVAIDISIWQFQVQAAKGK